MVNITVHSDRSVKIEQQRFQIENVNDMVAVIKAILDKAYYSGERLCLEQHSPSMGYIEIERWK